MTRKSDPSEWHLSLGHEGYHVVDAYDEDLGWLSADYARAKQLLGEMIREEIAAQEAEGPALDPIRGVEFPFAENH